MKFSELRSWSCFYFCCCQHWLVVLLVASILVNVSPENATANTTASCGHKIRLWNTICPTHLSNINEVYAKDEAQLIDTPTIPVAQQRQYRITNEAKGPERPLPQTMNEEHRNPETKWSSHTSASNNATFGALLNSSGFKALTNSEFIRNIRKIRQAEEQMDKCRLFVEGETAKNELYSPDYPNNYPKNINCTRVITAPKGQIIRLDFRNSFHIEDKEECKFDFLEIRDGQYGFSNKIGKYCGTDFPPEITSKERYLWLHFHSDESIEYSGFTAVYEFIDRNREAPSTDLNCTIEKDGYEGFINSTDVPQDIREVVIRNKIPLDCMWRIQVQDKWKIQVKFLDFKLSKPNDCETNFLDIFPEQTVIPRRVKNFCGSAGEGLTSDTNILHMRFYAEQIAINSTFAILYTAFRDRGNAGCTDEEYDCEDATCISKELACNGRDNCKFRWDEEGCKQDTGQQSEHMIIIMTVFGLILGGMVITFLVNCIRKIVRDQKIIREHIRQSKESKLDEMGRNSKARSRENVHAIIATKHPNKSQISLTNLDEVSNRYYRDVIATTVAKPDMKYKEHSILRQQHDMYVQTSLCGGGSENLSSSTTTNTHDDNDRVDCPVNSSDMACQTRESLFATQPVPQKSSFCDSEDRMSQCVRQSAQKFPTIPSGAEGCHLHQKHHHLHQSHMPKHHHSPQQQQQQNVYQSSAVVVPKETVIIRPTPASATDNKQKTKVKKSDESKILIDVRNSAPDVIIMTSH